MAVYFITDVAQKLLDQFNDKIDQDEAKGKITTWRRSSDGQYYTHRASEWQEKAWFTPAIGSSRLRFNIVKRDNKSISRTVYAYYHGHLIETFLNHFDADFTQAQATALASENDEV